MYPRIKRNLNLDNEPLMESGHFGSPYAPGPRYWLEYDPDLYYQTHNPDMIGSPYAPGPAFEPYEVQRQRGYGRSRYGSPYAPGPAYEINRMDRPRGMGEDRVGSPYAPGPAYPEPGPYAGIGPRNYTRNDQRIFEDICDRLMQHSAIDASEIDVLVTEGEVSLTGQVDSLYTKRAVEDTAFSVLGVRDVHNELKLSPHGRETPQHYGRRTGRESLRTGMPVVGRDGGLIGTIAEVRSYDFIVARESAPDVFVPLGACLAVNGGVVLDIPAAAIEQQDWPMVSG